MQRPLEKIVDGCGLDHPAGIHDRDAIGDFGHDAEIVGHEDHRRTGLRLQLLHQLQDLRLRRDVERGRRLVGDQKFRPAGERHGDHHALVHAAGKLVRIGVGAAGRIGNADRSEQLHRLFHRLAPGEPAMHDQHFGDLHADPAHRIERRRRILKDHRHVAAADLGELVFAKKGKILSEKGNPAGFADQRLGGQAHGGETGEALAAATLADQTERFTGAHVERNVDHQIGATRAHCQAFHRKNGVRSGCTTA